MRLPLQPDGGAYLVWFPGSLHLGEKIYAAKHLSTRRHASDSYRATEPDQCADNVLRTTANNHFFLIISSTVYVLAAWYTVATHATVRFDPSGNLWIWWSYGVPLMLALVIGLCANVVIIQHPARPLRWLYRDLRFIFTRQQLATSVLVLFLFCPVALYCMELKSLIPFINPINFDELFSRMDHWLGFGHAPQKYLTFLIHPGWRYKALSAFYGVAWFSVTTSLFAYTAFAAAESYRKSRFLLAYSLCWMLLGSVMAITLNSGGPIFFIDYTGQGIYESFVDQLNHLSGDTSWTSYAIAQKLGGDIANGAPAARGLGISAMPSMHVSTAFLVVLQAWSAGHFRRLMACLYCLLIYIGSIALGWHYAIDGIAAVIMTTAVWKLSGWLVRIQPNARLT